MKLHMPTLQMLKPAIRMQPHGARLAGTARISGSRLQAIRDRIMRRDEGVCRCEDCKRTGTLKLAHEVEHRTPLWAGGAESDSNRYAIDRACHKAKTDCETAMRHRGVFDLGACVCGRHSTG